jgi:hypothetical protein
LFIFKFRFTCEINVDLYDAADSDLQSTARSTDKRDSFIKILIEPKSYHGVDALMDNPINNIVDSHHGNIRNVG